MPAGEGKRRQRATNPRKATAMQCCTEIRVKKQEKHKKAAYTVPAQD